MQQFQEDIKDLLPIQAEQAQALIDQGQTATFFVGRATCPYCRRFATKLAKVVAETKAKVYFINSEEAGQANQLADFRARHTIPTVPGFLHAANGDVTVRCDSSMTEEEIKDFMTA